MTKITNDGLTRSSCTHVATVNSGRQRVNTRSVHGDASRQSVGSVGSGLSLDGRPGMGVSWRPT